MKCLNCGSEELKYDELSDMYFCPKCNRLYSKNDIEIDEDNITDDEDYPDVWNEDEDLNGFSLTVLSILQSIPIIGLIVPVIVNNSNVKPVYKKTFAYRLIGQFAIGVTAFILGAVVFVTDKYTVISDLQSNIYDVVQTVRKTYISKNDIRIPSLVSVPIDSMIDMSTYEPDVSSLQTSEWTYFNGVVMTGKQVISLVDTTVGSQVSYLLQTPDIAERHGKDCYRNFGYVLTGAESDSSKSNVYFIDKQSTYSFYTDDYGEYRDSGISDMSNSRYIFYVNPKKSYTFNTIENDEDEVIGFMFTEIIEEVKTSGTKKGK